MVLRHPWQTVLEWRGQQVRDRPVGELRSRMGPRVGGVGGSFTLGWQWVPGEQKEGCGRKTGDERTSGIVCMQATGGRRGGGITLTGFCLSVIRLWLFLTLQNGACFLGVYFAFDTSPYTTALTFWMMASWAFKKENTPPIKVLPALQKYSWSPSSSSHWLFDDSSLWQLVTFCSIPGSVSLCRCVLGRDT